MNPQAKVVSASEGSGRKTFEILRLDLQKIIGSYWIDETYVRKVEPVSHPNVYLKLADSLLLFLVLCD